MWQPLTKARVVLKCASSRSSSTSSWLRFMAISDPSIQLISRLMAARLRLGVKTDTCTITGSPQNISPRNSSELCLSTNLSASGYLKFSFFKKERIEVVFGLKRSMGEREVYIENKQLQINSCKSKTNAQKSTN